MKTFKTIFAFVVFIVCLSLAYAADKPSIYNFVAGQKTKMDEEVNAQLSPRFKIIDIYASKAYVPPKPIAGQLPRSARTESGEVLGGYVLVGYVVTTEGIVAEPFVIKTTDNRLNTFAFNTMKEWRFAPANLNGAPISTTAAQEFIFEAAPTEFITQVLEPTGGKILRPKDWFYTEGHRGSSYTWIMSREDATKNSYRTGVRIQTIVGVKEKTGKSGKQFAIDFIASKKKENVKVIKNCLEYDQGLFTRICLETEEGSYHILYSLFWGSNNMDIVVVSISGTTKELWDIYSQTFDKMSGFELIDMQRFQK